MSRYGNRQKHESKNPVQRLLISGFHDALGDALRTLAPRSLLDVGCGEGYVLQALQRRGLDCELNGIDRSEEAIRAAQGRVSQGKLRVEDALSLVNRGERYDVVMMLEVLEHIADPARMLPILYALSRRHVVLSVPWEPFFRGLNLARGKHIRALGNDPEHVNHWGRHGFMRFVSQHFVVREAPWVFPWTLLICEKR